MNSTSVDVCNVNSDVRRTSLFSEPFITSAGQLAIATADDRSRHSKSGQIDHAISIIFLFLRRMTCVDVRCVFAAIGHNGFDYNVNVRTHSERAYRPVAKLWSLR